MCFIIIKVNRGTPYTEARDYGISEYHNGSQAAPRPTVKMPMCGMIKEQDLREVDLFI